MEKLIDEQPLGLFDWTNDVEYPSQAEVREILDNRYMAETRVILSNENSLSPNSKKIPSHHSDSRYMRSGGKNENEGGVSSFNEKGLGDTFGEAEDSKIEEKYTKELLTKYKLTVGEINEGLALVNEESRKIISNEIMESTIYNIISEAIYGETDLSEKTRIYFFNK